MVAINWVLMIHGFLISCVCGQWDNWFTTHSGGCSKTCNSGTGIDILKQKRRCGPLIILDDDMEKRCPGSSKRTITRQCTSPLPCPGRPNLVNLGWGLWTNQPVGKCSVTCGNNAGLKKVRRSRICNNPRPRKGGVPCKGNSKQTDFTIECYSNIICPVDGQWSTWSRQMNGPCLASCLQEVVLKRTCTNPAPAGGGRECSGTDTKDGVGLESCTGGNCIRDSKKSELLSPAIEESPSKTGGFSNLLNSTSNPTQIEKDFNKEYRKLYPLTLKHTVSTKLLSSKLGTVVTYDGIRHVWRLATTVKECNKACLKEKLLNCHYYFIYNDTDKCIMLEKYQSEFKHSRSGLTSNNIVAITMACLLTLTVVVGCIVYYRFSQLHSQSLSEKIQS